MAIEIPDISMLTRREIEAQIIGPLLLAFQAEIGLEKTLTIAQQVIDNLAYQAGQSLAKLLGGNEIGDFAKGLVFWSKGGALELDKVKESGQEISFNVTKCKYADMYEALGLKQFGVLLSCNRDYALIRGFNPALKLRRTQTIMEGGACCDFRIVPNE